MNRIVAKILPLVLTGMFTTRIALAQELPDNPDADAVGLECSGFVETTWHTTEEYPEQIQNNQHDKEESDDNTRYLPDEKLEIPEIYRYEHLEVDTTYLARLINEACKISNADGSYTEESYQALKKILLEAEDAYHIGFKTQAEVQIWESILEKYIDSLVPVKILEPALIPDDIDIFPGPEQADTERLETTDFDLMIWDSIKGEGKSYDNSSSPSQSEILFSDICSIGEDIREQITLPTNLYEVAVKELTAEDSHEFPFMTDSIKYNEWLYGEPVANLVDENGYSPVYSWNTTFVAWCADQLGYLDYNRCIRTPDSNELYHYLTGDPNNEFFTVSEIRCTSGISRILEGDLIFIPKADNTYVVGIVSYVDPKEEIIHCIFGDVECAVAEMTVDLTQVPDTTGFVRIYVPDKELTALANYMIKEIGTTPAAACGILSNMNSESKFNSCALGDYGTSFGLCQWHERRWDNLIEYCDREGYDWKSFMGQLCFLKFELENFYPDLLNILQNNENDRNSAYAAGYYFCLDYERPKEMDAACENRGYLARNTFYNRLMNARLFDEESVLDDEIEVPPNAVSHSCKTDIPDSIFELSS